MAWLGPPKPSGQFWRPAALYERRDQVVAEHRLLHALLEAQLACILRQAEEGASTGEVCRKAGISEATFYVWRKNYGGLMPSEMRRLKQLKEENSRLKRIVADLSLDKEMLQDVIRRKIF